MQNKAYSTLEIKQINEEERVITGIASTPTLDRSDDIVEPEGVSFKLPLPLLWQHNHNKPIGHVTEARVTAKGIEIVAKIAKGVSNEIDEYWQYIKSGLVRGLSIGFRGIESEEIPRSWGTRFKKWEWYELSTVTVPANAEASILTIKKFDNEAQSASGIKEFHSNAAEKAKNAPGASGKSDKTINLTKPNGDKPMANKSIAEQISSYQEARRLKAKGMEDIMEKSLEDGETLDAAQQEAFDTLESEIKAIDDQVKRLEKMQAISIASAKPIEGVKDEKSGTSARSGVQVKAAKPTEKGIEFAQFAICLAAARGNLMQAKQIAETRYANNEDLNISLKSAVNAGSTTDPTWAAPLVDSYQRFAGDFVEFLRPQTILGRFGVDGVPSLRRVPFNISISGQTSGGAGYWVGEGKAKPLTKFDFNTINLKWAKVANIAVLTEELVRFSSPSAEALVRDQLAQALIERLDTDFVDPNKAAVADVSPASITNGVTGIPSTGNDEQAVRNDIMALFGAYLKVNQTPSTGVWIMQSTTALALSLMTNPLGQPSFPGVTMNGGNFRGMPVIVSDYVPAETVILANASDIFLADDGQVVVDASREASLQMANDPTNASNPATAVQLVSMFQTNSVAIRAERWINWAKRRTHAVQMLTGVKWGQPTTSGGKGGGAGGA